MRITKMETALVDLPLPEPLRTAIHEIKNVCCFLLTLHTDSGLTGEGYGFSFQMNRLKAIRDFTLSLENLVIGRDPHDVEKIWADIQRALNFYGQAGVAVLATNPIDLACWDLIGKAAGQPLYRLFGACRDRVPVYASGGLWLSSDCEALAREARSFRAQNFRAMKLRLGSPRWQDDIARVEAVRDAIGPDIALMVDANQGLNEARALRLGRELERFDLVWYEEPLPTWCDAGHRALAQALDVPLASGETEYTAQGIRRMVEHAGIDIMMPDLQRMGGYTEMRRACQYLAVREVPVSPHIFTEHSLHIVASSPNATWCEHMPWFSALFAEEMTIDADGMVALPDRPGIGFTFDPNKFDKYRLA
ncbi:mandelate racemase/muconate lactonizing enzyme family protein [Rhodoligotrophos ferricapiens]|uniref:mandelate racemase/muconate lactonizing enzyme family protein n=1 Tax=Rhodoligotrophos ferricapiens TaxID=3069264 RepID=UPI00315D28DF